MVSVGNHENSAGSLAHFTERFRLMPSNSPYTTATKNVCSWAVVRYALSCRLGPIDDT